jgi:TrmH family RNA methyltransferase
LEGDNIYHNRLPQDAVLVLGNEANGISAEVTSLVTDKITIPQFGKMAQTESLNVAMATAILLSEFRR